MRIPPSFDVELGKADRYARITETNPHLDERLFAAGGFCKTTDSRPLKFPLHNVRHLLLSCGLDRPVFTLSHEQEDQNEPKLVNQSRIS